MPYPFDHPLTVGSFFSRCRVLCGKVSGVAEDRRRDDLLRLRQLPVRHSRTTGSPLVVFRFLGASVLSAA
jgi:hypothetical protein